MATAGVLTAFRRATRSSFWLLCADVYPALVAASIPWSTTAVAVFMAIWFVVVVPTINPRDFLESLKRPAYWLPLALVLLAMVGTLWSDASWPERLHGISPAAKMAALPFLMYHYQRSRRGSWVFIAFLASCVLLMLASWAVIYAPDWRMTHWPVAGVPIKNTIDQSQEFSLCIFALLPVVLALAGRRNFAMAAAAVGLILAFLLNLTFIATARTALVYWPVLLVLFAFRYPDRRAALALVGGVIATAVLVRVMATLLLASTATSYLPQRVGDVASEYQEYTESHKATSTGQRLEWWQRSLQFIGEAPLIGNGTGSIRQLFERDSLKEDGWTDPVKNPHNQTLIVAIQWGFLGCLILYAMWCCHLLLFGGFSLASWMGLFLVVQNFMSSLFNSHLFDFTEGWIYVLGVGAAGGIVERLRSGAMNPAVTNPGGEYADTHPPIPGTAPQRQRSRSIWLPGAAALEPPSAPGHYAERAGAIRID